MTLQKQDYQKFMKRLRKNTGLKSIRYYACGEYGTKTWRPHYHAIIFGVTPEQVEKAWGRGYCHFGKVSGDSIAYTIKYICKESRVPQHEQDDRLPEFSLMLKRMGLNYLTPQMTRWDVENEASYIIVPGGFTKAMPRYFRDKIFNDCDKLRMNRILQQKFNTQFEDNVNKAGGVENYYRDMHYAVRQAFKEQNNQKNRNKNMKLQDWNFPFPTSTTYSRSHHPGEQNSEPSMTVPDPVPDYSGKSRIGMLLDAL